MPPVTRPPTRQARQRRGGVTPLATRPLRARRASAPGRRPTGDTPSVMTGVTTPWGRRRTGDPSSAAQPARADPGAPPHWRYALRHDGRRDAVGAPPHWRSALRCATGACRSRGAAPLAMRPSSRRAPRRRGGAAPLAIRLPLRARRARTPGRRLTVDTPSVTHPARADPGAPPHWRCALRHDGRRDAVGAPLHLRDALRCAPGARRPRGAALLAIRPSLRTRRVPFPVRRPTGDTPSAAHPARAEPGAPPHWRYAFRYAPGAG